MKQQEPGFPERLAEAAKAKRTLLEKARQRKPASDADVAGRQAARLAADVARKARLAKRNAAAKAEKARKAEIKAEEEAARKMAKKAEQEAREEQAILDAARQERLKAARDLKYAARKARR